MQYAGPGSGTGIVFAASFERNTIFALYDFLWVDLGHPVKVLFLLYCNHQIGFTSA